MAPETCGLSVRADLFQLGPLLPASLHCPFTARFKGTSFRQPSKIRGQPVDGLHLRDVGRQVLYSYKVNPQTAIYVGYSDEHAGTEEYDLTQTARSLFIKLSYAWVR